MRKNFRKMLVDFHENKASDTTLSKFFDYEIAFSDRGALSWLVLWANKELTSTTL